MAVVDNKSSAFITAWGRGPLDFQIWKTEKLKDRSFEYHAFVSVNNDLERIQSKGAIFMIVRITTPYDVESTQEYYMGYTGYEGNADDNLTNAWNNRATLTYKRYDEVIKEYFH